MQSDQGLPDHLAEALLLRLRERQRLPVSTYRLQLHKGFSFRDAQAIVPYLANLGISDCYCSPYLRARPGSMHGYDICEHNQINPELGSEADYQVFLDRLKAHDLGQILDFVPNHMAADADMNPWWREVLEDGLASPYAKFFDIDWRPVKHELNGKVLLPVLGDHYGLVLERGELQIAFDNGAMTLRYHEHTWPIDPGQYPKILRYEMESLQADLKEDNPSLLEFLSVLTALDHLPSIREIDPGVRAERQRQKKWTRNRLAQVAVTSPRIRHHIENALRGINGQPSRPRSFDHLHELLEAQPYRLAYWRTAYDEINYRRFFDINDLVGLRMEEPELFAAAHPLILRLVREQKITGLRLDHLDGLFDPGGYLDALQDAVVQEWAADLAPPGVSSEVWRRQVQAWRASERNGCAAGVVARPLFVAVEKILMGNEALPKSWPIHGTSGYVFLNDVNRLFVNPENAKAMTQIYERFTGQAQSYADVTYQCKKLITSTALASELNVLAHALNRISEGNRRARDFTLNYLREALRETVACFPVYRTYLSGAGASEADRQVIDLTLARARRRNPVMEPLVFGFLRQVLLPRPAEDAKGGAGEGERGRQGNKETRGQGDQDVQRNTGKSDVSLSPPLPLSPSPAPPPGSSAEDDEYRQRLEFAMKFQQYTGPVQAKGVEDTAFYRYNRLLSLNEVGGDPQRFGGPPEEFHEANRTRLAHWPYAMLATATHDTKRGEDARARLNVLSEIPTDWRRKIFEWSRINNANRTLIQGEHAPHRNDEYLFYQALLGAWPAADEEQAKIEKDSLGSDPPSSTPDPRVSVPPELVERLKEYMLKALREAKVFTSWINPDEDYDQAVADFVTKALTGRRAAKFLASFLPFQKRIARLGMVNSLAQVTLKIISPGVPDFYQGTELWDFSLVDPDNRRPVDFAHRVRLLESLESVPVSEFGNRITDLLDQWPDGRIKLLITTSGLRLRRKSPRVFMEGEYLPLEATGEKADHVVAIARRLPSSVSTSSSETRCVLAIVPRLVAGLVDASAEPEEPSSLPEHAASYLPVGANIWKTTRVILPHDLAQLSFRNIITGHTLSITPTPAPRLEPSLLLADVLSTCPVALLEGIGS